MKIKFESNQQYQLDAVNAVIDIFTGQPLAQGAYEIRFEEAAGALRMGELGTGNRLLLSTDNLLKNVRDVQAHNEIAQSDTLETIEAEMPVGDGTAPVSFPNCSVEMETGTGKTYVYLRTIYELRARYGFTKFIIVVPGIAIREGVMKSIEMTREHFQQLYGNVPVDAWVYDSKQYSRLRQFATSNQLQVLVINIDAFNKKDISVIYQDKDQLSGRRPIEFVQATQPIVIMDEPQNMETDTARAAIAGLNPLCTLRYSATHRNPYNLLYRLDPVKAYDLRLVKQIEVDSILETADYNQPFIEVQAIEVAGGGPRAKLVIDVDTTAGMKRKKMTVSRPGVDLFDLSGGRENYRGYITANIHAGYGFIAFTNGVRLTAGQTHGSHSEEAMKIQIHKTIEDHFEKELIVSTLPDEQRIKVLSLFFIDRVANYADEDGKIRRWFNEAYKEIAARPEYAALKPLPVNAIHNGYFAQDKGKPKDTSGNTRADDEAYSLIMRDKERLLSVEEPLRFIFSHSALREGWDNPNVFQICTLNETRSQMKKRQEIGRGMRLPVRMNGERCHDEMINKLTVVANESYREFAEKLQTEIEEETGVNFEGRVKDKRERQVVRLRKDWRLNPDFRELWDRIKHRTRYRVEFETEELIKGAVKLLKDETRMPAIETPTFVIETVKADLTTSGVETTVISRSEQDISNYNAPIPDLIGYLQRETELTRHTIADILIRGGRLDEVKKNPRQFLDQALDAIRTTQKSLMVEGIKYERIAGAEYEMMLFEEKEIMGYLDTMVPVQSSIYDHVVYESATEREFAQALDARIDIKLFIKLPAWFTVDTPLGTYNPDWAIVKQEDRKLYLVRETKGVKQVSDLRESEWQKIQCGRKHFRELHVNYDWVQSASDV